MPSKGFENFVSNESDVQGFCINTSLAVSERILRRTAKKMNVRGMLLRKMFKNIGGLLCSIEYNL